MHRSGIIAALAIAIGLGGCGFDRGASGSDLATDGARCDQPLIGTDVHVEIRYAGDGTPSAVPDECTVRPGTRITWRGADADGAAFVLRFRDASPAGRGLERELVSRERGERQRVALVAGETEGRYKYEIIANGIAVDPAVIIKR